MIDQPPNLSQSAQDDAGRQNFRKIIDWIRSLVRNGVDFTRDVRGKPTTVAGYGITDAVATGHTHAASDIASGTLAIARGGTGSGNEQGARNGLFVPRVTVSESEPDTKDPGDFWHIASTHATYIYDGSNWYTTAGVIKS